MFLVETDFSIAYYVMDGAVAIVFFVTFMLVMPFYYFKWLGNIMMTCKSLRSKSKEEISRAREN